MVVGEEGTNGGVWFSPVANTSRPTSSALRATATIALMRSCSVGMRPVVGSAVTSPTVKIPNCMAAPAVRVPGTTGYSAAHLLEYATTCGGADIPSVQARQRGTSSSGRDDRWPRLTVYRRGAFGLRP